MMPKHNSPGFSSMQARMLAAVGSLFLLVVSSCSKQEAPPPPSKIEPVRLIFPPEATYLIQGAIDRLNAKNIRLSSGAVVRLTASSFDDLMRVSRVGSGEIPASLWLAPTFDIAAAGVKSTPAGVNLSSCKSIMTTTLGVALRQVDLFSLTGAPDELTVTDLLAPPSSRARSAPSVVMGVPRYTSSGYLALLATASMVTASPPRNLTKDAIEPNVEKLRTLHANARSYFTSDSDALTWLSARTGGKPVAVITTEQSFKTFMAKSPSPLEWRPLSTQGIRLDYPLCSLDPGGPNARMHESVEAVRAFFTSEDFLSLLQPSGFSRPSSDYDLPLPSLAEAPKVLFAHWSDIQRPSLSIFIIPSTSRMDRNQAETIKRELNSFIDNRSSPSDAVAVIVSSTPPEVLIEPSTDSEALKRAITKLSNRGGDSTRDGLVAAFALLGDLSTRKYRRSIVLLITGSDSGSASPITKVNYLTTQFVGQKDVDLTAISMRGTNGELAESVTLTRECGGTYISSNVGRFPADFLAVARRIQ